MANEKKVVFSGDASLLNKAFASIRQARKEIGLDDEKFAKVSKENASELLKALELEIKQRTRLNNLKREEAAFAAKQKRDHSIKYGGESERASAHDTYRQEMADLQSEKLKQKSAKNDLQTSIEEVKGGLTTTGGGQKGILGDLLKFEVIKQVAKGVVKAVGSIGNSLAGSQDESNFSGSFYGGVVGAIPFIGAGLAPAVKAAKDREEQEQKSRVMSQTRLRAITGNGIGANIGLGLTSAESAQMAEQYARSGGSARNLGSRVFESYAMQKAFGLDQNQMLEQEKLGRITGTGGSQNIANVIAALKSQGIIKGNDYSQVPELVNAQNSLIREQSKLMSTVDAVQAGGIVATLAQIGGGFSGERLGERISTVNQSLINPNGDFQQASNFAALTSLPEFKNASYFDLIKAQQGGLSTKGFLGAKLDLLSQQYGGASTEGFKLGVMDTTGLSASDSELLANFYKNNPQALQDFAGSTGDIQKMLGKQPSGVTQYEQQQAGISEKFSESFVSGIGEAMKIAGEKVGKELAGDFIKLFKQGSLDSIKEENATWMNNRK